MAVASFEDFCASLCALIGADPLVLEPDENDEVGFTVTHLGTRIGFKKSQQGNEPAMLMVVDFGAPPEDQEAEALRNLLDANFMLAGTGSPSFARNPDNRQISLQQSVLLSQLDVHWVYNVVINAGKAVENWSKSSFGDQPSQAHPVAMSQFA